MHEIEAFEAPMRQNSDFLCLSGKHLLQCLTPKQSAAIFFYERPQKCTVLSHTLGKHMSWIKAYLFDTASPAESLRFIPTQTILSAFRSKFYPQVLDINETSYFFCTCFFVLFFFCFFCFVFLHRVFF